MGKRKKSSRKPGAGQTKLMPLDKTFRCLFCQHTGTVNVKIDLKGRTGRLDCKDCRETFSTDINHLTAAIDIYAEWIDACEKANPVLEAPMREKRAARARDDDEDDDALGEEDLDAESDEDEEGGQRKKKKVQVVLEDDEDEEDLPDMRARAPVAVEDDEEE